MEKKTLKISLAMSMLILLKNKQISSIKQRLLNIVFSARHPEFISEPVLDLVQESHCIKQYQKDAETSSA